MDFTISSSVLYKHLSNASRTLSGKPTLPILDNFLFTLEEGALSVMASDLETTVLTVMQPDAVRREGAIAIPSRLLLDTLKEFPDMPLHFSANMDTFRVQVDYNTGDLVGEFSLIGADAGEFPQMPELDTENTVEIRTTTDVLISGISHTLFSASTDSLSPHLCGILILVSENSLRFVSTDANRLASFTRTDVICEGEHTVFLPSRPAALVNTIMSHGSEELLISFDERNLQFTTQMYRLVCRLTESKFPPFEQVIPRNHPFELVVDRVLFHNALRQVSPFSHKGKNLVSLTLTPTELTVSAKNVDTSNEAYQKIACRYSGEEVTIHFNTPFLTEALSNISSQEVKITISPDVRNSMLLPTINESEYVELFMVLMQAVA